MGGRGRWISEFEASVVYRVSSRTARAIQSNPVSKKPNLTPPQKLNIVGASELAQQVKSLVINTGNLSLIPKTFIVEREPTASSYPVTSQVHHGLFMLISIHL